MQNRLRCVQLPKQEGHRRVRVDEVVVDEGEAGFQKTVAEGRVLGRARPIWSEPGASRPGGAERCRRIHRTSQVAYDGLADLFTVAVQDDHPAYQAIWLDSLGS